MTSVLPGSESLFFRNEREITDHILQKILSNKKRHIGTEWEMFFVDRSGKPLTRAGGQKVFSELQSVFALLGYEAESIRERTPDGNEKTVGLNIKNLGTIMPEAGYQLEFSSSVCGNCEEVREKNEDAHRAITEVAKRLDYTPVFQGHLPGYAENAEGMDRSRGIQWREYYNRRFGEKALSVREAQDGTASVQVTIDAGAEHFHEFFRALLLIEPAFTLYYTNSRRSYIGLQTYGELIPSQVRPLAEVWGAKTPRETVKIIVGRLMQIEIPFLPDDEWPGLYKAEPLTDGLPPTAKDLMERGRLHEKFLNNIGGFFYTRPALKNFSQALLEMRGVDSQSTPGKVAEIAQRVCNLLYDDEARARLLRDYDHVSIADIYKMHEASMMQERTAALRQEVTGTRMAQFTQDIMARSQSVELEELYDLPSLISRQDAA